MKRLVPVAMVLILFCNPLIAQESPRGKYLFYNIGINAILGGIGAVINKTGDDRLHDNFIKGLGKGALGGALIYGGKEMAHLITSRKNLWYAWPARIVNSAGSSIVSNGMYNRGVFDRFHFHLGFVRLDFDRKTRTINPRINTSALFGAIVIGMDGRLNMGNSLKTGLLMFDGDQGFSLIERSNGLSLVNAIGVPSQAPYNLLSHELLHHLQYEGMPWMNAMVFRLDRKLKDSQGWYAKIANYLYLDLDGPLFWLLYDYGVPWSCRYFEREADFFSSRIIHMDCN